MSRPTVLRGIGQWLTGVGLIAGGMAAAHGVEFDQVHVGLFAVVAMFVGPVLKVHATRAERRA